MWELTVKFRITQMLGHKGRKIIKTRWDEIKNAELRKGIVDDSVREKVQKTRIED